MKRLRRFIRNEPVRATVIANIVVAIVCRHLPFLDPIEIGMLVLAVVGLGEYARNRVSPLTADDQFLL